MPDTMNIFMFGFLVLLATQCRGEETGEHDEESEQQMSIDEIIASSMSVKGMDYLTDLGKTMLWDMDMVLTFDQWREIQKDDEIADSDKNSREKRKAIKRDRYRWTGNTIPYSINTRAFDSRARNEIRRAIDEWQKYTCIRFTPRSSQRNYVYFDNGSGCYSYVGMTGGAQTIGLAGGCRYKGVIVHEIGHAVGFHHEQNRPDRDKYVRIIRQNIPSNLYYNFKKYPYSAVSLYGVPYDYGSIMHYGGTAFSTNGRLTIQTLDRSHQNRIGNRKGLSFRDIKLANLMYSCNERCSSSITCPGEGFVGKDCKCWCPGNPVQPCQGTTGTRKTPRPTTRRPVVVTKAPCRNMNRLCGVWAREGYCQESSYMQMYCKPACNLCETKPKPTCVNEKEHCNVWRRQGYCRGMYASYMKDNCRLACGYCKRTNAYSEAEDENGSTKVASGFFVCLSSLLMLSAAFLPLES